jgi:Thermolysin metallopeptidase, alpha-helical domain/Thermolysin metallopeptidase, catalytic domain
VDLGTLSIAIIGALGGGGVTGLGGWLRGRRAVKSAARLIHAELTDNTASIRYYRRMGGWPSLAEVRHAAWDQNGVTLSRMRSAKVFHTIQQGYSALESIAFVARASASGDDFPSDITKVLEDSIRHVQKALRKAGSVGGIAHEDLKEQLAAMDPQPLSASSGNGFALLDRGAVPPAVLEAFARAGTPTQRASATRTLETMKREAESNVPFPNRRRTIRDAKGKEWAELPGEVVRREGDEHTGDPAVDELYDGLGAFYKFFFEVFSRDSFDGRGAPLEGTVHYGEKFNNMIWSGTEVIVGDGDGELFTRLTAALELIAHEAAMGLVQTETRLRFANQAGALMSSIANVFGVLVKQYKLRQTAEEADWLLGVGILGPRVQGGHALQSMKAPGTAYDDPTLEKDPQPAHMKGYVRTKLDNGGIHSNSGIPNHAFYTTAIALGGPAWERAGRIWYEALRDPRLRPTSGFQTFAGATRTAAERLYGKSSDAVGAVDAGWEKVGVPYPA